MYRLLAEYYTMWSRVWHSAVAAVAVNSSYGEMIYTWSIYLCRQSMEKQVSEDLLTGGKSILGLAFSINKPLLSLTTRFLKTLTFSIWKHSQKNTEGNKWASFAITTEIKSTMFTKVIQLQQRPSYQRLNKRLNCKISVAPLIKSSKN